MENKCSVEFIGRTGLLFTNENGERFCVYCRTLPEGKFDKVLYSKDIRPIDCDRELTDNERETIISKILELTKKIKWKINES
jgi:hypothetical protein